MFLSLELALRGWPQLSGPKKKKLSYKTICQDDIGGTIRQYPRRKLTLVQNVEIPLHGMMKGAEYSKEQILELWEKLIKDHQLSIDTNTAFQSIERQNNFFQVQTNKSVIQAKTIVLALGRRGTPRKLGVPGEELSKGFWRISVSRYSLFQLSQARLTVAGFNLSPFEGEGYGGMVTCSLPFLLNRLNWDINYGLRYKGQAGEAKKYSTSDYSSRVLWRATKHWDIDLGFSRVFQEEIRSTVADVGISFHW